jgi:5-methyltetrahydrofolate--homocysteine methyltransferase
MIIIGELINSTRSKVKKAIEDKNEGYIRKLVKLQVEAGANYLDVNSAMTVKKEIEDLKWLIEVIQDETDVKLAIDTPAPEAMEAGIKLCKKPPLMNSITNEGKKEKLIKIAKEYNTELIALPLGSKKGLPVNLEDRLNEAKIILGDLEKEGINQDKIYLDVLILGIGSNPSGGRTAIQMAGECKKEFPGIKIIGGLSNISFGLPDRKLLNRVFLAMMIEAGLDGAIIDPSDKDLMETIIASEAITGRDKYCKSYIKYMRGKK